MRQFVQHLSQTLPHHLTQGGKILCGGTIVEGPGNFVHPTIVEIAPSAPIVQTELFVPILYVMKFSTFEEAVALNNGVPQV